jgi:hypothetical protein
MRCCASARAQRSERFLQQPTSQAPHASDHELRLRERVGAGRILELAANTSKHPSEAICFCIQCGIG